MNTELEIKEAKIALTKCRDKIDEILNLLSNTKGWSLFDIVAGETFSSLVKRDKINNISREVEKLNELLKDAKGELEDIDFKFDSSISNKFSDKVLDIAFDNIFTDLRVNSEINQTISDLENLRDNIDKILAEI